MQAPVNESFVQYIRRTDPKVKKYTINRRTKILSTAIFSFFIEFYIVKEMRERTYKY